MRRWLHYREVASFAEQVERYLELFPPEQIAFVVHDDLVRDPAAVWRTLLEFLEIDPSVVVEFRSVNENRRARSGLLRDQLLAPSRGVVTIARRTLPGSLRVRLKRRLREANSRPERRPPMDPALRRRLEQELAPDVRRLGELIGR